MWTQGSFAISLQLNLVVLFNLLFWYLLRPIHTEHLCVAFVCKCLCVCYIYGVRSRYSLDTCQSKEPLQVNCTPPADGATECDNAVDCVFEPGQPGTCDHRSSIGDADAPSSEVECHALEPSGEWSPPTQGELLCVILSPQMRVCTCCAVLHWSILPINAGWMNACASIQARAP